VLYQAEPLPDEDALICRYLEKSTSIIQRRSGVAESRTALIGPSNSNSLTTILSVLHEAFTSAELPSLWERLAIYSWKGAYQYGSIDSVIPVLDLASTLATTSASVPNGNLTGNGFALVHHTCGIVFCNSGPGGDGSCPSNVTTMKFTYIPGVLVDKTNYTTAFDFSRASQCNGSTAHPELVNAIKIQALNAFKTAFANLPAIISHPRMFYGGTSALLFFEHAVYVDGGWFDSGTGYTTQPSYSWVYYPKVLLGAERISDLTERRMTSSLLFLMQRA
jgi:hypothetical protein